MNTVDSAERRADGTDGTDGTAVFERYRRLLFTVAYDMLGSVADAEDCVQEAWIRWTGGDRSDVADPKGYLVRITANLSLNRLRAARSRRESYVGPWLPEPLVTAPDVADEVERADEVSYAMLVVLETLNPVERAVFVLREVFGVPHAEIAEAVGKSEAAVRQLAHRAREHVHARRPRHTAGPDERRRLTERFLAACSEGDVAGLKELLAADAIVLTDGGGKAAAAVRPLFGADRCARFMAGIGPRFQEQRWLVAWAEVNGAPGIVFRDAEGHVEAVALVEVTDGAITEVLMVRNPDKLTHLRRLMADTAGRGAGHGHDGGIGE
ncbi:RNA polymerase sigma-70 factor (ECF subfamily) [Nocardiopsis mwathae]|uniref:RNA polymerase sigma-70 factor (ECF subfamily) n=1 Tax=Nocardiopsis mwathae TaxID=1472723 RepID=A0A7W9YJN0_9ACTN|nr:RNA polymerase sigma-70 factor (ECF subfamily) [Nocardiopsis mwathae]